MNLQALLALFARSTREDMRSRALLWARVGIAAAVLFAMARSHFTFAAGGAPGLAFFSSVAWMNFIFICLAGMSYFASAITEEKEEGTLGMLRMTDLSPVAILLGKSTSRLLGGLLLLLVQVPFVLLAITLGGVRLDQVFGCYALLGAFLFFACNIGLLGSVVSRRTGVAAVIATVIGIVYFYWPLLLQIPLLKFWSSEELALAFCVPVMLDVQLENRGAPIPIGGAVLALLGGGMAAFVISWLSFERFSGDEAVSAREARRLPSAGNTGLGRPARAWSDAICWKDYHFLHGGPRLAALKAVIYLIGAIWLGGTMLSGRTWGRNDGTVFFATLFGFASAIALFESLFATSRIYRLERKQRTFSSLMTLPTPFEELLRSKRRAVLISLIPALFFTALPSVVLLGHFLQAIAGSALVWAIQGLGLVVAQLYFNHALVAWFSLRLKWGGLPLALGISWIANSAAIFLSVMIFRLGALMVLITITIFVTVALRKAVRRQLELAAAED